MVEIGDPPTRDRHSKSWGETTWSAASIGSILYLAVLGTAFTFVALTVLLRELPSVTVSFIAMAVPFGALALAVAEAVLVVAGVGVAQLRLAR